MVKKKKKKSRKKNLLYPKINRKIKTDANPTIREGGYIWIGFVIIAVVLNYFSSTAAVIFGGLILLAIIRRGWY
tara:strand:+ start:37 stop:258 length:222 start_codon:yes stop_codon:yes gene_type:complete